MNETIGLIGIGVMGSNIALNFSDKNIPVHVFNKSKEKINSLINKDSNTNITGTTDIEEFVNALPKPRKILMMIPSGKPSCLANERRAISAKKRNCTLRLSTL